MGEYQGHNVMNGGATKGLKVGNVCIRGLEGLEELLQKKRMSGELSGDQMPIADFEFWFQAIRKNDHCFVREILSRASPTDKQLLLNGRFVYDCQPQVHDISFEFKHHLPCSFERPLLLAAVFRSTDAMSEMLHFGANLFVQDNDSSTVIHGIIWADALKPLDGTLYLDTYAKIMDRLNGDEKRQVLFIENAEGLRPLELAARLCTFDLFQRILDTEGVYVYNKGWLGGHMCSWYDVTDYESHELGRRMDRSPLKMLTVIEKEHMVSVNSSKLTSHYAIRRWVNAKIMMHVPYLSIWFLLRVFYAIVIFVSFQSQTPSTIDRSQVSSISNVSMVSNVTNLTSGTPCGQPLFLLTSQAYYCLLLTVVVFSMMSIIFDILECLLSRYCSSWSFRRCYHVFGSRHFVVKTRFYRISNFLLALSVLVYHLTFYLGYNRPAVKSFMLANILNIWSLLFFIQFVPALGYFVTIIKRMLKDMFHFLVIYVILFFSFSQTFYNIFTLHYVCSDDFSTVLWSMYTTFRIMLNMVELHVYEGPLMADLALLHVTYVIVISILLINFLIALMSNSVSEVAENRSLVMLLQRLSAALLVERRLLPVLRPLFRRQQQRFFICKEGRVYLECFILKDRA